MPKPKSVEQGQIRTAKARPPNLCLLSPSLVREPQFRQDEQDLQDSGGGGIILTILSSCLKSRLPYFQRDTAFARSQIVRIR